MTEEQQAPEEEAPNANEESGRVVLSTPEQAELREESDIELDETKGVPGQIVYPETAEPEEE